MKNYVQEGESLTLIAPTGGVVSGVAVKIGGIIAIPSVSVAAGLPFVGLTEDVFDLSAATSQAWATGDTVYWDDTAKVFTKTASGNTKAGQAVADKASASATGRVKLIPTI